MRLLKNLLTLLLFSFTLGAVFGLAANTLPADPPVILEDRATFDHNVGNAQFTVSNHGHYGFGIGSMWFTAWGENIGVGFKYPFSGPNNLFESGLLVGVSADQIADCVRDSTQGIEIDFFPTSEITIENNFSDQDAITSFTDEIAPNPMGLDIQQKSYMWGIPNFNEFVIIEYEITNLGTEMLNLAVGHFNDWDFPFSTALNDRVDFDREHSLGYMFENPGSNYRGVTVLSEQGLNTFKALSNQNEVYPPHMTDEDKWAYMTFGIMDTAIVTPEDASYMIAVGPFRLGIGETEIVTFAYVAGDDLASLQQNAENAYDIYWGLTSVGEEGGALPVTLRLAQNYPNPFNAATQIRFTLPEASDARLEMFNMLGQKVATLADGHYPAGNQVVSWNAGDLSSGIYFYKLTVGDEVITKRMTLLK